jgi:hypothetical protein
MLLIKKRIKCFLSKLDDARFHFLLPLLPPYEHVNPNPPLGVPPLQDHPLPLEDLLPLDPPLLNPLLAPLPLDPLPLDPLLPLPPLLLPYDFELLDDIFAKQWYGMKF